VSAGPLSDALSALPGVADAVERARTAIAAVQLHPANRRGWARSAAVASIRAARASAALAGGSPVLDPDATAVADPVLAGALRAGAAVGRLVPVWERAPLQALATLHRLAVADLPAGAAPGRPVSPSAADRLARLGSVILGSSSPGPVLAAVVHAELLTLRPFGSADGVVARCATRLTLISTGLDPKALTVPEVGYLRAGSRYIDLAARFVSGAPADVGTWLTAHCEWLVAGAREAMSIADVAQG